MPETTGEANGADSLIKDLIDNPELTRVAVVTYDVQKITDVIESGDRFPTLQLLRLEPIVNPDDLQRVRDAMQVAYQERTGSETLPFDEDFVEVELADDSDNA
jgi:hypothetical protein